MENKIAIDIQSISNFSFGGINISVREILDVYRKEGILLYDSTKGVAPVIIEGNIKLIDYNTEEGKEYLKTKFQ